jgi:ABC-type spermidine/putrescine transport system permease subunit II
MKAKWRFITALVVAPLCAPLVMFLIISLSADPLRRFIVGGTPGYSDYLGGFEIIMLSGAIVSYTFAVLFGIPLYCMVRRLGPIGFWSLSIGGAAIASVPFVLLGLAEGMEKMQEHGLIYPALAICGFVVGSVFYLISDRRSDRAATGKDGKYENG